MAQEDVAQDLELRQWELNNLNSHKGPTRFEPGDYDYGPEFCDQCGDEMPVQRREWGFRICVSCKSATEPRRY